MALIDELKNLTNPTVDLGGGPREDDSRALAQLILGGGRASVGGRPVFGGGVPNNDTARELQLGPGKLFGAQGDVINLPVQQGPATPAAVAPISRGFDKVLNTANAVADSLTPSRASTVDEVLLPNPYGPGSYNPKDPEAVAKVKAQGERADRLREARDFLSGDFLTKLPPGAPVKDIVGALFESMGLVKTEAQKQREIAQAKAEGERAGGKGVKTALPPDLLQSIGKPEFDQKLTDAVATGSVTDPNLQVRLQQQHNTAVQKQRVTAADARAVSSLTSADEAMSSLEEAYKATPAFKTGKISDVIKSALATNNKAASFAEALDLPVDGPGFTDADREFATQYNAVRASLRDFSSDTRFSDTDKLDVLRGIGSPATGPKIFPKQMAAMRRRLATKKENYLESLKDSGYDVSKFEKRQKQAASANAGTAPQAAIDYLNQHPEAKEQFKAKYGYLP